MPVNEIATPMRQLTSCRTNAERESKVDHVKKSAATHLELAKKRLVEELASHHKDIKRHGHRALIDTYKEQFNVEQEQVRTQLEQSMRYAQGFFSREIRKAEKELETCHFPNRDAEEVPVEGLCQKATLETLALNRERAVDGERAYLQGKRFAEANSVQQVLERIATAINEKNVDLVSSLIENVDARHKGKVPVEFSAIREHLEKIDFFHEKQLKQNLSGLKELHAFVTRELERASKPLCSDAEIYQLVDAGLKTEIEDGLVSSSWN